MCLCLIVIIEVKHLHCIRHTTIFIHQRAIILCLKDLKDKQFVKYDRILIERKQDMNLETKSSI